MKACKKILLSLVLGLCLLPAQAGMVTTADLATVVDTAPTVDYRTLRLDVQRQLIENGVEPTLAGKRVAAMTDDQVAALRLKIAGLPAGAGGDTTDLLLVIILLVLLL